MWRLSYGVVTLINILGNSKVMLNEFTPVYPHTKNIHILKICHH